MLVKKIDDDWYVGRLGNQEGMFPVKFVEIIEDLPQETTQEDQVRIPEKGDSMYTKPTLFGYQ